jgi:hypothetical protein
MDGDDRPRGSFRQQAWAWAASVPFVGLAVLLAYVSGGDFCAAALAVVLGLVLVAAAVPLVVSWSLRRARLAKATEAGRELGLSRVEGGADQALLDFGALPLFRSTRDCAGPLAWCCRGRFDRHPVALLEYDFRGEFESGPVEDYHFASQTVVVVEGIARLPNFVLAPRDTYWGQVGGAWLVGELRARPVACLLRDYVLWGEDEQAVRAVLTPERLAYFGRWPGWTVECWDGLFLVYAEDEVYPPERFGWLLNKALVILRALTTRPPPLAPPDLESALEREAEPTRLPRIGSPPGLPLALVGAGCITGLALLRLLATLLDYEDMDWAIWACVVGLAWVPVFLVFYLHRRRTTPFACLSLDLGLTFAARPPLDELERFDNLPLLCMTTRCRQVLRYLMEGVVDGRPVALLEYEFGGRFLVGEDLEESYAAREALAIVHSRSVPTDFLIAPRGGFSERVIGPWLEANGLAARMRSPHDVFAEVYVVWAADPAEANVLFTAELQAQLARSPGWAVESWGGELLVHLEGERLGASEWPDLLRRALEVSALLAAAPRVGPRRRLGRAYAARRPPSDGFRQQRHG